MTSITINFSFNKVINNYCYKCKSSNGFLETYDNLEDIKFPDDIYNIRLKYHCSLPIENLNWEFFDDKPLYYLDIYNFMDNQKEETNKKVKLPSSIKEIKISPHNYYYNIQNLIFPQKLEKLIIPYILLEKINLNDLKSLKEIGLVFDDQELINDKIIFPDYIKTLILLYNTHNFIDNLPSNFKILKIRYISKPITNLPNSLEKLEYENDNQNYIEQSKIPFGVLVKKVEFDDFYNVKN